jgi:hypothetical protein
MHEAPITHEVAIHSRFVRLEDEDPAVPLRLSEID